MMRLATRSIVGICAFLAGTLTATAQEAIERSSRAQRTAYSEGGLRAAAAITGHFVHYLTAPESVGANLPVLCRLSDVIIVGDVSSFSTKVTDNGMDTQTILQVQVHQSLKGSLTPGTISPLVIEGGKVIFEGGSWAETVLSNKDLPNAQFIRFESPTTGRRYVFFGTPAEGATHVVQPRDSLLEVDTDSVLHAHGPKRAFNAVYDGQPLSGLIRDVQAEIKKSDSQ
jgi:hypothetical protein